MKAADWFSWLLSEGIPVHWDSPLVISVTTRISHLFFIIGQSSRLVLEEWGVNGVSFSTCIDVARLQLAKKLLWFLCSSNDIGVLLEYQFNGHF
jgi:hypothetical protein